MPATQRQGRQPSHGPSPRRRGPGAVTDLAGEHLTRLVAVDEEGAEGGEPEEHDEDVEQPGARVDEVVALEGEQRGRDGAEQVGAEEPARDPAEHEDRDRAGERDGEAPAEGVEDAERRLAPADEPLADGRVDDEVALGAVDHRVVGGEVLVDLGGLLQHVVVLHLEPVQDHRPALLDVVRLVEDQLVRGADVPEAHDATDEHEEEWSGPAEPRDAAGGAAGQPEVVGRVPEQASAHLSGRVHGRHRMQCGWVGRAALRRRPAGPVRSRPRAPAARSSRRRPRCRATRGRRRAA